MAKAKKKKQKKATLKRVPHAIPPHVDRLYKAVAHYVEKSGGKLVVIGGIQVQEWPGDALGKFTLGIKCLGRKPQFASSDAASHEDRK